MCAQGYLRRTGEGVAFQGVMSHLSRLLGIELGSSGGTANCSKLWSLLRHPSHPCMLPVYFNMISLSLRGEKEIPGEERCCIKIINTLPGLKQKASCLKTWDPRPVSLPLQGSGSLSGGCKSSPPLAYQAAGLVVPRSGGTWEGPRAHIRVAVGEVT